jgi:predicted ATPase/DNA-binding SARP family transcriptional activator
VRVAILGPLLVHDGDRPVEVGGQRLRALLVRLAVDPGRPVSVDAIADALWADDPPTDRTNAVQSLVSRLRRALPDAGAIESGPAGYRLVVEPDAVDAVRFERLAADGRRALAEDRDDDAAKLLREALALWRGPALADVPDAGYAAGPAARWEELRLACLGDRIRADLALGRAAELVAELEALVEEHPLREHFRELLVRALAGAGRQAEALAAYETTRRTLADDLGVDPSPALQAVHVAVLRGDLAPRPAAPARRPPRTNLRAPLTSFVGREADVARIGELLERSRLVTLVGPGGAGKTRLAGEAARRLPVPPADGVWLVELAPIGDPANVPTAILGALNQLDPGRLDPRPAVAGDPLAPVADALANREVLLILDNCEHLVDTVAKTAESLLGRVPGLRVLATSREPLGIFGESLWPLRPLASPATGDTTPEAALATPAVRLFADRASLVRPGFALDATTTGAVAEICRRLDGLPLAIELAAARLRTLSVEAVAARLGDRFRLLTGGSRTAASRHQTLRAVVAWSWDLLTETERRLAERISVFPGGATAADVEAVCADGAVPAGEVLDLVTALTDKSLLAVGDGAEPRYRMLETIREFAAERLAERGDVEALRRVHARYYLALAEEAEPHLRREEQVLWLERLDGERDNLVAALRFAVETGDAEVAVRMGAALAWYWTIQGMHLEAVAWLDQALGVPGEAPDEAWTIAASLLAISLATSGQGTPGEGMLEELKERLARLDVLTGHPLLALVEPGFAIFADDVRLGVAAIERNLRHLDPWARAMLHLLLGMFAENDGDLDLMRAEIPLAVEGFREVGDRWGAGTAMAGIANLHSLDGDDARAMAVLADARRLMQELRATDDASYTATRMASLRARAGDLEGARHELQEVLRSAEDSASANLVALAVFSLGVVDRLEGDLRLARERHLTALEHVTATTIAAPQVGAAIHAGLACLDVADGDLPAAAGHLRQAWDLAMSARDMPIVGIVGIGVAAVALARGDAILAAESLGAAACIRGGEDAGDPDLRRLSGELRAAIGDAAYEAAWHRGQRLERAAAFELLSAQLPATATDAAPRLPSAGIA